MPDTEVSMEELAAQAMGVVEETSDDTEQKEQQPDVEVQQPEVEADPGQQSAEEDSGRLNAVEQSLYSYLEGLGIPQDKMAQIKTHLVPQSKFTRLRSKDREQVRAIVQEAQQIKERENQYLRELHTLRGGSGNQQPGTVHEAASQAAATKVAELIKKYELDETNPAVASLVSDMYEALKGEVLGEFQKAREPEVRAQQQHAWIRAAEGLRLDMVAKYGDEINQYFPELLKEVHESGYTWTPQALFIDRYPEVAEQLRLKQARTKKPTQNSGKPARGTMEGMVQGATPRIKTPSISVNRNTDNSPSATAAAVLREMGMF